MIVVFFVDVSNVVIGTNNPSWRSSTNNLSDPSIPMVVSTSGITTEYKTSAILIVQGNYLITTQNYPNTIKPMLASFTEKGLISKIELLTRASWVSNEHGGQRLFTTMINSLNSTTKETVRSEQFNSSITQVPITRVIDITNIFIKDTPMSDVSPNDVLSNIAVFFSVQDPGFYSSPIKDSVQISRTTVSLFSVHIRMTLKIKPGTIFDDSSFISIIGSSFEIVPMLSNTIPVEFPIPIRVELDDTPTFDSINKRSSTTNGLTSITFKNLILNKRYYFRINREGFIYNGVMYPEAVNLYESSFVTNKKKISILITMF